MHMSWVRINVSLNGRLLAKIDARAKKLTLKRSEYLRKLVLEDFERQQK